MTTTTNTHNSAHAEGVEDVTPQLAQGVESGTWLAGIWAGLQGRTRGSGEEFVSVRQATLTEIGASANELARLGQQLGAACASTLAHTQAQSTALAGIAAAVRQLLAAIQRMSEPLQRARQADEHSAQASRAIARQATLAFDTLAQIQMDGDTLGRLAHSIEALADETRLCALNAVIENAHTHVASASQQGLDKLAAQVSATADETTSHAKRIVEIGAAMAAHGADAQSADVLATQCAATHEQVRQAMCASEVALAECTRAAGEIVSALERIAHGTQHTTALAQTALLAARQASRLADDLTRLTHG